MDYRERTLSSFERAAAATAAAATTSDAATATTAGNRTQEGVRVEPEPGPSPTRRLRNKKVGQSAWGGESRRPTGLEHKAAKLRKSLAEKNVRRRTGKPTAHRLESERTSYAVRRSRSPARWIHARFCAAPGAPITRPFIIKFDDSNVSSRPIPVVIRDVFAQSTRDDSQPAT